MSIAQRLNSAIHRTTSRLLAERTEDGIWEGELSTSALSTATAVSALATFRNSLQASDAKVRELNCGLSDIGEISELIDRGVTWITAHQNSDGGFGDTTLSYSNIATSMLVVAALELAGKSSDCLLYTSPSPRD